MKLHFSIILFLFYSCLNSEKKANYLITPEQKTITLSTSSTNYFLSKEIGNSPIATDIKITQVLSGASLPLSSLTFIGNYVTPVLGGMTPSNPGLTSYTVSLIQTFDALNNSTMINISNT